MIDLLSQLTAFEQVLWSIGAFSTVFFLLQTILLMAGFDFSSDTDTDLDHSVDNSNSLFTYLSLRNVVIFLMFFSFITLAFMQNNSKIASIGYSFLISMLIVSVIVYLMKLSSKLSQDNTPSYTEAIGKLCKVYLTIPKGGIGKISIVIGKSYQTVDAISTDPTVSISTGEQVKIVQYSDYRYVVEKL